MNVYTSANIADLLFRPRIYNAAGTVRTPLEVSLMLKLLDLIGIITIGSISLKPREGNAGSPFYVGPQGSVNALGLPNGGRPYYEIYLPIMIKMIHDAGKKAVVSIAADTPEEFAEMAILAFASGADSVELNGSCPNKQKEGGGFQRPICYDMFSFADLLAAVQEAVGESAHVGIKVGPYTDPYQHQEAAKHIGNFPMIKYLVACNTFPNAYATLPDGKAALTTPKGLGGYAGNGYKSIVLGQLRQWDELLPDLPKIGVGGISTGRDMADYFKHTNVAAVQIATALLASGKLNPKVIESILNEYSCI